MVCNWLVARHAGATGQTGAGILYTTSRTPRHLTLHWLFTHHRGGDLTRHEGLQVFEPFTHTYPVNRHGAHARAARLHCSHDRKRLVTGQSMSVRVDIAGRSYIIKKKN